MPACRVVCGLSVWPLAVGEWWSVLWQPSMLVCMDQPGSSAAQDLWEVLAVVKPLFLPVPAAPQTVVGTDIAELLLQDHKTVWLPGKSPNEANLIDFTNEALEQAEEEESGEAQLSFLTDSQAAAASTQEKETERFRELLLYGRKKVSPECVDAMGVPLCPPHVA